MDGFVNLGSIKDEQAEVITFEEYQSATEDSSASDDDGDEVCVDEHRAFDIDYNQYEPRSHTLGVVDDTEQSEDINLDCVAENYQFTPSSRSSSYMTAPGGHEIEGNDHLVIPDIDFHYDDDEFVPRTGIPIRECAVCHSKSASLLRCALCKEILYCSKEHQRMHWKFHKLSCRITSIPPNNHEAYKKLYDTKNSIIKIPLDPLSDAQVKANETSPPADLLKGLQEMVLTASQARIDLHKETQESSKELGLQYKTGRGPITDSFLAERVSDSNDRLAASAASSAIISSMEEDGAQRTNDQWIPSFINLGASKRNEIEARFLREQKSTKSGSQALFSNFILSPASVHSTQISYVFYLLYLSLTSSVLRLPDLCTITSVHSCSRLSFLKKNASRKGFSVKNVHTPCDPLPFPLNSSEFTSIPHSPTDLPFSKSVAEFIFSGLSSFQ